MEAKRLKPCPFCGEKLNIVKFRSGVYYEHPENDCFLASADSEYGAVWISVEDTEGVEAWERRTDNGQLHTNSGTKSNS